MITRRSSLKLALAAAVAPSVQAAPIATRIIDTHTHFYDPTRKGGVPWPSKGSPLYRPVYPKDWAALANPHGIRETVVVEASKLLADNDWILDLAAKESCIVGFVGNLQPADADFAQHVDRLAKNALFRGIRVSGDALLLNLDKAEFIAGCRKLAAKDLSLDVNGVPDLTVIAGLAAKVPDLRIVIDHCGGCGDAKQLKPDWKPGIAACAKQPKVFMKVSGLVEQTATPAGQAPTDVGYYLPILDTLWEQFGEDRLIYGSNWPVSDKGSSYASVFKLVSDYFTTKGATACEKYFGQNSRTAYRWIER